MSSRRVFVAINTMQKHESAFTLIELMITIAVAAVVLTLGVPSFSSVIERNQLSAYTNQLVSSLHFARSEAVRRNQPIKVCHSNNATDCNGTGYENGWIIFVDDDDDGSLGSTEELIRVNEGLPANYTFNVNGNLDEFAFNSKGISTNQGRFVLCKNNTLSSSRAIFIGPAGRTRLAPLDDNGIPEASPNTPITTCNP